MVRQFQKFYFKGRYQSTLWGYTSLNFARVAQTYGIEAETVGSDKDIQPALAKISQDRKESCLREIEIDTMTNAYPKLAFGRIFGEMEPLAKPIEREGT